MWSFNGASYTHPPVILETIQKALAGDDLQRAEAAAAVGEIMDGAAPPARIAAFATALRAKGETVDEIVGAAEALRQRMIRVDAGDGAILDTCGTGGDGRGTLNVSTLAALVCAASGVKVAKHGNRAASSKCGSADLLEALGLKLELPKERLELMIRRLGFAFLMAPSFHPALKHAAPVRRELGFRTIFNFLGPLANPASANVQTIGVGDPDFVDLMAKALAALGTRRSFVFGGETDELTPAGPNRVREVLGKKIRTFTLGPADFHLRKSKLADLAGGSPADNAAIARDLLAGKLGPQRDVVVMNAAAALVAAGRAGTWADGAEIAESALHHGDAQKLLDDLVAFSNDAA